MLPDQEIEGVEHKGLGSGAAEPLSEEHVERLVALGRALSDPIRVMMADGRKCCDLPDLGVPVEVEDNGVCEFEYYLGMGRSKVYYHTRELEDARLVREERRGTY